MPDFGIQVHDKNNKKRETKTTFLFLRRAALEWRENNKTFMTPPTCTHGSSFF